MYGAFLVLIVILELKKIGVNVHHIEDTRTPNQKKYIPSLRPLALKEWLKENPEIPHSNDFPCSNPRCEVRFKMVLGIFYGDNVFCTSDCLKEWEKKK